jgi:putative CocE/NonD family hydrolase
MRTRLWLVLMITVGLLLASPAWPQSSATEAQSDAHERKGVDVLWGVKIPMRDGVKLNATVYKPMGQTDPLPVIFLLSPYTADSQHDRAMYFARDGYVFGLVDCRGRGNSGGQFEPFVNEGRDGYDTVEWFARQPWSNGRVAMYFASYLGFDQWSTLKEFPPHLTTIVPTAAAHPGVDFPFFNNFPVPYDIQWLTETSGLTRNRNLFSDNSYWHEKFRSLYLKHLPFQELDRVAGNPSPIFQKWLEHITPDSYWEATVPNVDQYKQIHIPVLSITGHYDAEQPGAMGYYRRHMQYGTPEALEQHYLIIGPWDHAGTATPRAEVGGLTFGPASVLDMNKLHKEWYDWTMKGGSRPEFLKKRVAYYVPGLEQWKYADNLEGISKTSLTLYLHSDGNANDVFRSGGMGEQQPASEPPDKYTYDPMDVRPEHLERKDGDLGWQRAHAYSITDQSRALNLFGNGLVYHSAPFAEDTEITGYVKLTVWIAIDTPDTDFQVFLYEILPDGTSIGLTTDQTRARYRESLRQEKLVRPGEINRYDFQSFTFFSRRIAKGSRLRLLVISPNSIYMEKNYNSGGIVARESGKDARVAHITLYHDAEHPSKLELPMVK